ncbi:8073_t:CDS:2 [Cetraspora pellucida]|uniref:8073_t:CDS:1 n=1 Tax=Cetraspora pellucida TaxID=1433469 RepID=A0A9N8ZHE4_9GLOM|nr:8073_t:CDS:2 [Cetraspora pellucida]
MYSIKSVKQNEIEQLSVLNKFIDNVINIDIDDHVIPDQCEQLWVLNDQIYNAFQDLDPNSYSLFEYTMQNTSKEYTNMENCY